MIIIVLTVKRSDDQTAMYRDQPQSTDSAVSTKKKRVKLGKKTREVGIQGILYVASFLLTWIFGTANRIQNAVVNSHAPSNEVCNVFALVWLHSLFVPAQGFFNFLVYIYPRYREAQKKKEEEDKLLQKGEKRRASSVGEILRGNCLRSFYIIFGDDKSDSRTERERRPSTYRVGKPSQSGEVNSYEKSMRDEQNSQVPARDQEDGTPPPHDKVAHTSKNNGLEENSNEDDDNYTNGGDDNSDGGDDNNQTQPVTSITIT